jgi:hypothetical protein
MSGNGGSARREVRIKQSTFYIRPFEAFLGVRIFGDLQKHLLGPLVAALDGKPSANDEAAAAAMFAAVARLSETIDGETLERIIGRLIDPEYVAVEIDGAGEPRRCDKAALALAGLSVADLFELCYEIVRHNYADFITRWGSRIGQAGFHHPALRSGGSAVN